MGRGLSARNFYERTDMQNTYTNRNDAGPYTDAEKQLIRSYPPRSEQRLAVIDGLRHRRYGAGMQLHYEPFMPYFQGYISGHESPAPEMCGPRMGSYDA